MLVICVVDVGADQQVYRVAAVGRLPELNESEFTVNQQICDLLSDLPVGN